MDKYEAWINEKLQGDVKRARERCSSWVPEMIKAFPELIEVRGWIITHCGEVEHWWCKTESGEIVDPTKVQFLDPTNPRFQYGVGHAIHGYREYTGELPKGKCMNCGDWSFISDCYCSPDCLAALDKYYGGQISFSPTIQKAT